MDRHPRWISAAVGVAVVVISGSAAAQTARSGGNASAQLMQQLAAERSSLQAEDEKLKSELAAVKKERDALKSGQQALASRAKDATAAAAHSTAQREAADQELTQTKAKMQELVAKFRETIQKLHETEVESTTAKQTLATREKELSICADHNLALYHLNEEVLDRLDQQGKKGIFSRMAQTEPFTRVKRVQLENLIDDYHSRAQDQLLTAPSSAPPAAGTGH